MNKKLSIVIPCYNQTTLLEMNLRCLERQVYKDFSIIIIDDQSLENYPAVIEKFPNLDIIYVRNEKNLGAMGNIFNSIFYKSGSQYQMSLHEDDAVHPYYLDIAIKALDEDDNVSFVCTCAEWFKDNVELENKLFDLKKIKEVQKLDRAGFVRSILEGKHIMLGSVVYRTNVLDIQQHDIQKYMEKYDVLCDRPFLTSLIGPNQKIALVNEEAIFTRDHGEHDGRFKNITEQDNFNLMEFYHDNLPKPLSKNDAKKLLSFSTNILIYTYPSIIGGKRSFPAFMRAGKELGLVNLRYINRVGIVGVAKLLFGEKVINKITRSVK
jgi:glycosyltransferase involved in cell wall biosynthesis